MLVSHTAEDDQSRPWFCRESFEGQGTSGNKLVRRKQAQKRRLDVQQIHVIRYLSFEDWLFGAWILITKFMPLRHTQIPSLHGTIVCHIN